jgi:NAD(P)H-dependent FMN reductase
MSSGAFHFRPLSVETWSSRVANRRAWAGVGGGSAGGAEAVHQQRQVASGMPAEVLDEQVRRPEDGSEQPEGERRHEDRDDNEHDENRQRRAHQQSEEHHARDLDGAERLAGGESCQRGVLLELFGG